LWPGGNHNCIEIKGDPALPGTDPWPGDHSIYTASRIIHNFKELSMLMALFVLQVCSYFMPALNPIPAPEIKLPANESNRGTT
jgi:hypothetical protein